MQRFLVHVIIACWLIALFYPAIPESWIAGGGKGFYSGGYCVLLGFLGPFAGAHFGWYANLGLVAACLYLWDPGHRAPLVNPGIASAASLIGGLVAASTLLPRHCAECTVYSNAQMAGAGFWFWLACFPLALLGALVSVPTPTRPTPSQLLWRKYSLPVVILLVLAAMMPATQEMLLGLLHRK